MFGLVSCSFHVSALSYHIALPHSELHHHELCALPDRDQLTAQGVQSLLPQTDGEPGLGTPRARLYE